MTSQSSESQAEGQKGGSRFDHPVYRKISKMNGEVNRMDNNDVKHQLYQIKLDCRGVPDVLKKRLKNHKKRRLLTQASVGVPKDMITNLDFLLVIDFEATCEDHDEHYNHEIIEFPIVLIDVHKLKVVGEFQEYVRPCVNQTLTKFCTSLTGITQDTVDSSAEFAVVFEHVQDWMKEKDLFHKRFAVVTDGSADMKCFMSNQCRISDVKYPAWGRKWVNMRKIFSNCYLLRRNSLANMLDSLEMTFEGKPHSGIDDARNIARICIQMVKDGAVFKTNEFKPFEQENTTKDDSDSDAEMEPQNSRRSRRHHSHKPAKEQQKNREPTLTSLEKFEELLEIDKDNGADPMDLEMMRKFCTIKC